MWNILSLHCLSSTHLSLFDSSASSSSFRQGERSSVAAWWNHIVSQKKKKRERLLSTTAFNWMDGSKRQSYTTAEGWDMGQRNTREVRLSLPLPWTSTAAHVPRVPREVSWESCSKSFWLWKCAARTPGSSYTCPATTRFSRLRCFSLQSFSRLQWIWRNGIQVNNKQQQQFLDMGKTKSSHDARLTQHHIFLFVLASQTIGKTDGILWWEVWLLFRGVLLIQKPCWPPGFHHQHCTWTVFDVPEES